LAINMRYHFSRFLPFLLVTISMLWGCTLEEPAGTTSEGQLIAVFPDEGAAAVPLDVQFMVETGGDSEESVEVVGFLEPVGGTPMELSCEPTVHAGLQHCIHLGDLEEHTEYTFRAEVTGGTASLSSTFTTSHPEGLGYEIAHSLRVERVGGLDIATDLFNALLAGESELLLVSGDVHDEQDLPSAGTNWVWGPGAWIESESAYAVARSVGYPLSSLTMVDDEGTIFGSSSHSYLPLAAGGSWLPIRVDDLVLRGSIDLDDPELAVTELRVEANVPSSSIDRIAANLDATNAELLKTLIELDTDTDLDGRPDAARLVLTTEAVPAPIIRP